MARQTCLYHLTSPEKWKKIQKSGLRPSIGENAALCWESRQTIFLSDHHSIPFWQILLDTDVLLKIRRIDLDEGKLTDETDYNGYKEYLYLAPIQPERVQRVYLPKPDQNVRETLCRNYLWMLSDIVRQCADYYNKRGDYDVGLIQGNLRIMTKILPRLGYPSCNRKLIQKEIKAIGNEGEYAFTDRYKDTKERLWSQLIHYPEDTLTEDRKALYNQIRQNFTYYQRTIDTGGYTTC